MRSLLGPSRKCDVNIFSKPRKSWGISEVKKAEAEEKGLHTTGYKGIGNDLRLAVEMKRSEGAGGLRDEFPTESG